MPVAARPRKPRPLPPVRPSTGFGEAYRASLDSLVRRMHDSVVYWLSARYKQNEPVIAQDELPAVALRREIRKLGRRWQTAVNGSAPQLAAYFAQNAGRRSDKKLAAILRKGGISVQFKLTRGVRDVTQAAIAENVALIRSIPQEYFKAIEGHVMRSVATGRDLASLTDKLEETYGVTRRRAAFIARDQNNKATATITRARHLEVGIRKAIWLHSRGGKTPRPRHLAFNGQEYDIAKGAPVGDDDGNFVHPGEEINCRCVSKPIVIGFS